MGYLAIYAFVNLGAFAVAAVVGTRHPASGCPTTAGWCARSPAPAGRSRSRWWRSPGCRPASIGLLAKVVVFDAAAGPATWLAVVMAVNVAIGLVYYARWLRRAVPSRGPPGPRRYDVPNGVGVAIGLTFTAGLVFSVFPGWLLDPVLAAIG